MRNPARVVLFFLIAAALSACATTGTGSGKSSAKAGPGGVPLDASPEERAIAKWTLLINGNFGEAWEFFTPGARSAETREDYAAKMETRAPGWVGARFVSKKCQTEDSCLVSIEVVSSIFAGRGVGLVTVPSFIAERWLRLEGVWYYAPAGLSPGDLRPSE